MWIYFFQHKIVLRIISYITIIHFLLCISNVSSQSLEIIDNIYGGISHPSAVVVNKYGQRYYSFNRVYDSVVVNNQFIDIPPKVYILGHPYFWGRSYLISVSDEKILIKRPGGSAITLDDTSVYVATTIVEDTLLTEDSIFINQASDVGGQNLLLIQYDFENNVTNLKHWATPCNCHLTINDLILKNNEIYFSGEYSSLDLLILDKSNFATGYANAFFGKMDNSFTFQNVGFVEGTDEESFIQTAKNLDEKFLMIGSSASNRIEVCDDTIYNSAEFSWGSTFLFTILFDSMGVCLSEKAINYDYGGIMSTSITALPDNSFLVSGVYNSTFIELDQITLHNPNNDQRGFIYNFNADGILINAFQLEGTNGSKRIESIAYDTDGNIWLTGTFSSDTIKIGDYILINENPGGLFSYLARLDHNLKPIFAINLEGHGKILTTGKDGHVYLLESLPQAVDDFRLYKINTQSNALSSPEKVNDYNLTIYPNPVKDDGHVNFSLLQNKTLLIERVKIFNVLGHEVDSKQVNSASGSVQIDEGSSLFILEFQLNDGMRIVKKLFRN